MWNKWHWAQQLLSYPLQVVSEDSVTKDSELLLTKGARGVRDQADGAENSHHPLGWSTGRQSFRRISDQHSGETSAPDMVADDDSVNHVHVEVHVSVDLRQPRVEL